MNRERNFWKYIFINFSSICFFSVRANSSFENEESEGKSFYYFASLLSAEEVCLNSNYSFMRYYLNKNGNKLFSFFLWHNFWRSRKQYFIKCARSFEQTHTHTHGHSCINGAATADDVIRMNEQRKFSILVTLNRRIYKQFLELEQFCVFCASRCRTKQNEKKRSKKKHRNENFVFHFHSSHFFLHIFSSFFFFTISFSFYSTSFTTQKRMKEIATFSLSVHSFVFIHILFISK